MTTHGPTGGRLQVRILRGRALRREVGLLSRQERQLYFLVTQAAAVAGGHPKSQRVDLSCANEAKWDRTVELVISQPLAPIVMSLHEREDLFIGQVEINLYSISNQEAHTKWMPLCDPHSTTGNGAGDVEVELRYKYQTSWTNIYLGACQYFRGEHAAAVKSLEKSLNTSSETGLDEATVLALFGYRSAAHLGLGEFDDALNDAKRMVAINPNSSEGYYRQAMVFYEVIQFDRAKEAVKQGLDIDPESPLLLRLLRDLQTNEVKHRLKNVLMAGRKAHAEGNHGLAVDSFSSAIELNPLNHVYHVYRAFAWLGLGDQTAAENDIMRAVTMNPAWAREPPILKQGALRKATAMRILKKGACFLKYNFLFFCKFSTTRIPPPSAIVVVQGRLTEVRQRRGHNGKHIELVSNHRTVQLKAASPQEGAEWRAALQAVPQLCPLPEDPDEYRLQWEPKSTGIGALSILKNRITGALTCAPILLTRRRKSGYLLKLGVVNVSWKSRWFVILQDDPHFYWFDEKPTHMDRPAQPHKRVSLLHSVSRFVDQFEIRENYIDNVPGIVFQLEAEGESFILCHKDPAAANSWLDLLRQVSNPHQAEIKERLVLPTPTPSLPPNQQPSTQQHQPSKQDQTQPSSQNQQQSDQHPHHETSEELSYPEMPSQDISFTPRRIANNQISASEAAYFSRFGLEVQSFSPPGSPSSHHYSDRYQHDGSTSIQHSNGEATRLLSHKKNSNHDDGDGCCASCNIQ